MDANQREELKKLMNAFIDGDLQTPPLCTVAGNGTAELVTVLLEKFGADKNAKDSKGNTPLMHAVFCANVSVDNVPAVKTLLDAGADLNVTDVQEGATVLHHAAGDCDLGIVDLLLAAGADFNITDNHGQTALHSACNCEQRLLPDGDDGIVGEIVVALLNAGVDVSIAATNGATALHAAAFSAEIEAVNAILAAGAEKEARDHTGSTPLMNAADSGRDMIVETLLRAGAEINARDTNGLTSLHAAAGKGHLPVVKTLLVARADVNMACNLSQSALHLAAAKGHNAVARTLLLGGANKDAASNSGYTPLMGAVFRGHLDVAVTLLEAGADVTIQDEGGETALHMACGRGGHVRMDHTRLLLRWGADERVVDNNGRTPRAILDEVDPVDEEERESVRQILARAPADRADRVWRRRGWLVILRKRTDGTVETCPKKQKSGVGGGQCLDMAMVAILAVEEGVFRNVVSFL